MKYTLVGLPLFDSRLAKFSFQITRSVNYFFAICDEFFKEELKTSARNATFYFFQSIDFESSTKVQRDQQNNKNLRL